MYLHDCRVRISVNADMISQLENSAYFCFLISSLFLLQCDLLATVMDLRRASTPKVLLNFHKSRSRANCGQQRTMRIYVP
jgi:hypothetical protein